MNKAQRKLIAKDELVKRTIFHLDREEQEIRNKNTKELEDMLEEENE